MKILKKGDVVFKRYEVVEFVGEGGMQEVYKATDLALKRTVALKTPKNDHGAKRFQRSAIFSSKVKHPSVATTLDYFETGDRAYLVEEFIQGVDLKKVMANTYYYVDPHLGAQLATHLAKGLAACHAENIWHRDLKPANIMVSDDLMFASIKITDFGIAKMIEQEFKEDSEGSLQSSITGSQTLLGALPFMAPECIFTPKDADKRADIWSFGAILYYILFGVLPFGSNLGAVIVAINAGQYPEPPAWMRNKTQFKAVLDGLWEIVKQCLARKPEERPTAKQLVEKLAGLCFSVYPREIGTTQSYVLAGGKSSFLSYAGGDAFYHLDSYYKEGRISAGERVSFSMHSGLPSGRAFPLVLLRPSE